MSLLRHFLVCGVGTAVTMPALAFTLTLRPCATPPQAYVALEDIAIISGLPPGATYDALRRMRVAALPRPGQELRLTRKLLTTRLRYAYPALAGEVLWSGTDAVVVSIESQLVDTAQLQSVAESALRQALSPLLGQLELHVAESLPPQSVPKGDLRIKANPVKTDMLSKRMKVHVELAVGEQYRSEITVWFDVNGQITVPVARTDIVTGTRLDETILERKVVNLGSVSLPLLYDSIPFHQMRTRHTVPGGTTLTRADLEPAPTISRQQEVVVQIAANGISIETSGIALSDAELGESVRIRNPISGEDFVAQVIGPGTAQLTVR